MFEIQSNPSSFFSSRILLSLLRVPPYTLRVLLFLEEKLFLTCTIKPQNHHHRLHLHHHHHGHSFPFGCNRERELTSLCFAIIDQFASITSHLLLHRHFFTLFTLSVSLSLLLSLLPVVPLSPVVTFRRRCSNEGDGQLLQSPQSCSAPSLLSFLPSGVFCCCSAVPNKPLQSPAFRRKESSFIL